MQFIIDGHSPSNSFELAETIQLHDVDLIPEYTKRGIYHLATVSTFQFTGQDTFRTYVICNEQDSPVAHMPTTHVTDYAHALCQPHIYPYVIAEANAVKGWHYWAIEHKSKHGLDNLLDCAFKFTVLLTALNDYNCEQAWYDNIRDRDCNSIKYMQHAHDTFRTYLY